MFGFARWPEDLAPYIYGAHCTQIDDFITQDDARLQDDKWRQKWRILYDWPLYNGLRGCMKNASPCILLNKIAENRVLVLMGVTTERVFEIITDSGLQIAALYVMFLTKSVTFSLFESMTCSRFNFLPLVVAYSKTWRTPSFCKCNLKILLSKFKRNFKHFFWI